MWRLTLAFLLLWETEHAVTLGFWTPGTLVITAGGCRCAAQREGLTSPFAVLLMLPCC